MTRLKDCPNCPNEIPEDALFCSKCGYSFYVPPPLIPNAPVQNQQPIFISQIVQPIEYTTKVVFYGSERRTQKCITKMEKEGWEVVSSEVVQQGYGCFKTGCLGCLFLPFALVGKKPNHFKVVYRRPL